MADSSLIARGGGLVRARGERWCLHRVEPGEGCTACVLVGLGASNAARRLTLLAPFDRIEPWERRPHPRVVTRQAALRAAAAAVAAERLCGVPAAAAAAGLALLSWQLVPAILLSRGLAHRLLLADAVGLGKTVQAGLAVAELRARGLASRTLLVVPAGLRDVWAQELTDRFGLAPAMADLAWLARRARALPPGVNPWSIEPLVIASIDFVKQPEVLAGLAGLSWDLLVVDEAHTIGSDSARARTVAALARRALRVLLVTATPHDGDPPRFAALAGLGRLSRDEPPATLVRRTRASIGMPADRRERILRIGPTPDEHRLLDLLAQYSARVMAEAEGPSAAGARLGTSVLLKRGLSSASALERTLQRRLALVSDAAEGPALQPALPLDPDDERSAGLDEEVPDAVLRYRGLAHPAVERAWLRLLAQTARVAARRESKVCALRRLLRRCGEPALIFTEYRDTLGIIARQLGDLGPAALLHGALGPDERERAVRAFTRGPARLLLATDVASEGLNLHERCRLAITFELPWNPLRLEQRVGRVDRIGQRRRVHAVHLVARGTREEDLLTRLETRRARIARALPRDDAEATASPSLFTGSPAGPGGACGSPPPASSSLAPAGSPDWPDAPPADVGRKAAGRAAAQPHAPSGGDPQDPPRDEATIPPPAVLLDLEAATRAIQSVRRARRLLAPAPPGIGPAPVGSGTSPPGPSPHGAIEAAVARTEARLARGHPWVACLRPSARRPWSGMLLVFVATRWASSGHESDRTALAMHVPMPVPVLRRRQQVRAWAFPRIAALEAALGPCLGRHLAARWTAGGAVDAAADARQAARRALVANELAEAARRQTPAPSLFGRYAASRPEAFRTPAPPGPRAAGMLEPAEGKRSARGRPRPDAAGTAPAPSAPASGSSGWPVHTDGPWLALVLLAPGDGRQAPLPPAVSERGEPALREHRPGAGGGIARSDHAGAAAALAGLDPDSSFDRSRP